MSTGEQFDPANLFTTSATQTVFLFPASAAYPKGIWVELKSRLGYGEKVDVEAALFKGMSTGEARTLAEASESQGSATIVVDTAKQKKLKLATWIADWNLPGPDGKTIQWPSKLAARFQVISSLNSTVGEWLEAQIDKIIAENDAAFMADADSDDAVKNPLGLRVLGDEPDQKP